MDEFEPWRADIRAHPEQWLAPIIRSGRVKLALELVGDNPRLLHRRFSGNGTPLLEAAYSEQFEIADHLLAMGAELDFVTAIALGRTATVRG